MSSDERFMKRCIELAIEAQEAGDQPFGSVIVDANGQIVVEGRNREVTESDVSWHAEMDAIRQLTRSRGCRDLSGYTLYASGEPCVMCAYALRQTSISRVVIGAPMRNPLPAEWHPLKNPALASTPLPEITSGILLEECLAVQERKM